MRQGRLVAGLDVGTTKVCALLGEIAGDHVNILSLGRVESSGLRKGMVVNIDATVASIRAAVHEAGKAAGVNIHSVYTGIAGGHIHSLESYGVVGVRGGEVTEDDIERAIEAAKAVYVPLDREVLHVIPVDYAVDGQDGILNPAGMSGVRLESKVQIVTGSVAATRNLVKCCHKAGLNVLDIILEPIASALAVLSDEEKDHGTVLIDIGGGTTDIAFYHGGVLRNTVVIGIGGHHITNDIAVGLRVPFHEAERVKKEWASAIPDAGSREEIDVLFAGRDMKRIPRSYLTEIVHPRCEELFSLVKAEIHGFGGHELASYGAVLSGGSSLLKGIDTLCEAVLGMPVRIGIPEGFGGLKGIVCDPAFSTGIGLVSYALSKNGSEPVARDLLAEIVKRMKGWIPAISGMGRPQGRAETGRGMKQRML